MPTVPLTWEGEPPETYNLERIGSGAGRTVVGTVGGDYAFKLQTEEWHDTSNAKEYDLRHTALAGVMPRIFSLSRQDLGEGTVEEHHFCLCDSMGATWASTRALYPADGVCSSTRRVPPPLRPTDGRPWARDQRNEEGDTPMMILLEEAADKEAEMDKQNAAAQRRAVGKK